MKPGHARIEVRVFHGDLVVQEFSRTTIASTSNIQRMTAAAQAWLQAWSAQLSDRQWQTDTTKAEHTEAA